MNKKKIQFLISLAIIALSMFYAFKGVNLTELKEAFVSVKYIYLFPSMCLVLLTYLFRAMRWRYLIRSVKEVKISNLISPLMVGFMANMLPARAGEFVRAYLLSRKENISFSASFATIFIERLFDLTLLLLMLISILLFLPGAFVSGDAGDSYQLVEKAKLFGGISAVLCLFIFLFSALLQFKNEWAMKIVGVLVKPLPLKWREKVFNVVLSFTNGLKIIRDRKGFFAALILSFLVWTSILLTYYPLFYAFDIAAELPIISSLFIICVTVSIFITVAPTPGFLGSFHLACVAALHGIFGIQKAVALSYGIVTWFVSIGLTVFIGATIALKENLSLSEFSSDTDQ